MCENFAKPSSSKARTTCVLLGPASRLSADFGFGRAANSFQVSICETACVVAKFVSLPRANLLISCSLHTMPLVHSQTPTNHPLCKHNSSLERHYAHGSRRSQQNTSRQTGHTRPRRAARAHHPTRRPRCAMSSGSACVQMLFPHVASRSCRHQL